METKKSILTPKQKIFLNEFIKEPNLSSLFYFTGGTALAEFYLMHRLSEDLDFFSEKELEREEIYSFTNKIKKILKARSVNAFKKNGRDIFVFEFENNEVLKVEFVRYSYKNLKHLKNFNGVFVNDLFDIAVNKIFAIFSRNETKDFVDLFFLLKKYDLNDLLSGVEKKFEMRLNKFSLGNEFYKARNITQLPRMIKKISKKQLTDFYKDQAKLLGGVIF